MNKNICAYCKIKQCDECRCNKCTVPLCFSTTELQCSYRTSVVKTTKEKEVSRSIEPNKELILDLTGVSLPIEVDASKSPDLLSGIQSPSVEFHTLVRKIKY
jgi:hypothetical protein